MLSTLVVLGASAGIAIYGHATMVYLQRVFAVALTLVLDLVLAYSVDGVDWSARGPGDLTAWRRWRPSRGRRGGRVRPDLLPVERPRLGPLPAEQDLGRSVFWTVFLSSGVIALFLSMMGVLLASRGDMSNVGGVKPFVPGWCSSSTSSCGGRLRRQQRGLLLLLRTVPAVDRPAAQAVPGNHARHRRVDAPRPLHPLRPNFTNVRQHFVALLVVWLAPFAAVWVTDG